jgi:hypothetical protein
MIPMTAFLFTYNPDKNLDDWSRLAKRAKPRTYRSTTSHKLTRIGDRFYLLQQGKGEQVMFGVGRVEGPVRPDPTWGHLVRVEFSHLKDPAKGRFLIPREAVRRIVQAAGKPALASLQRSGMVVPPDVAEAFEREIARLDRNEERSSPLAPPRRVVQVERERQMREIEARQGAGPFRDALMRAYQERCAITGCTVPQLLEAAHIVPYADQGANSTANGLLLRADLHTAFDLHLVWVDVDTMEVRVAPSITDAAYRALEGKALRTPPPADAPDAGELRRHAARARMKHARAQERGKRLPDDRIPI